MKYIIAFYLIIMLGLNLGAQQIQYDGDLIQVTSKRNNVQDSNKIVEVLHFKMDSVEDGTEQVIDQIIETTVTDPGDSTQTITRFDTTYFEVQLYRDVLRRVDSDGQLRQPHDRYYGRRIERMKAAKIEAQDRVRQININIRAFERDSTKLAGVLTGTITPKGDPKLDEDFLKVAKIADGFDDGEEASIRTLTKSKLIRALKLLLGENN